MYLKYYSKIYIDKNKNIFLIKNLRNILNKDEIKLLTEIPNKDEDKIICMIFLRFSII